jgi:alpha/beta superfamily hydrolase
MRFMLEMNFDGRHFAIKSYDRSVNIDSMFFPATNEKVVLASEYKKNIEVEPPSYLAQPTVIICNPNALFYHHMVNAPNAFWLNFFLKRGVNVMAWNYRGYADTNGTPTPYNIKMDGEAILNFLIAEMQVKGKIGVYGRSLGGVVATHLANTFPDLISLVLADRTFGNLKSISRRKFPGGLSLPLFNLIS